MEKFNKRKPTIDRIRNRLRVVRHMRKSDLTSGMIRVIIMCWLVPYLTLSIVLFYSSESKTDTMIRDTVSKSMENAANVCKTNIMNAIAESKNASYDGVIKKSYTEYMKTGATAEGETKMYQEISTYLKDTYKYSNTISCTILIFNRMMTKEYYTYSNVAGATYATINEFRRNAMTTVRNAARGLGTGTKLLSVGGHLYLVRNIVTSDYVPFAMLVMEVNTEYLFQSVDNVVWRESGLIYMDNQIVNRTQSMDADKKNKLMDYAERAVLNDDVVADDDFLCSYDKNRTIVSASINVNKQKLNFVVELDKVSLLNEMNTVIYIYVIIVILLIPLLFATFYYFYTNINKPISELLFASEKIEDGEYGYKIQPFQQNEEFRKLIDTFNHMSVSLQESFNRIYAEEVAIRDAKMHALQSQINPHFLNNTLEIINWKARMSGNDDVSGMIESLGIMMEATMNRWNESFVTVKEELRYVDAYLYIIVQRFGNKFRFTKEINEEFLDVKIPRLIIQPLIENMVDHGGDVYGNRVGKLRIFGNEEYLHIVVENNGNITEKEMEKIHKLLSETSLESQNHNIGIRNVNIRLKLLYGQQSGLAISNPEEDLTVSEVVIERKKVGEITPKQ